MRFSHPLRSLVRALVLLTALFSPVYPQCSTNDLTATETLTVTDTLKEFTTPGYRVAYYPNMDCKWIFDAGRDDATIVFNILEMLIESYSECKYDSLTFYQGNSTTDTEVKKLCGRVLTGDYITVTGRYALLRMRSDRSRQYAGAKMEYFYGQDQSGGACAGSAATLTATTTTASLTTPGFPATTLTNGVTCQWTITSGTGTVVHMEIIYSDLWSVEGMCLDQKLSIYDGSSSTSPALLGEMCDSRLEFPSKPTVYYSTGNVAHVTLVTSPESFATSYGFKINYKQHGSVVTTTTAAPTTTTPEETITCSSSPTQLTVTSSWEYFRSINYPEDYPNNVDCRWHLEAPVGSRINLTFVDSFLQASGNCQLNDAVNVYDGSSPEHPLMRSFCGEDSPSLVSTGRFLYVQLRTDASVAFRGFNAMYQTVAAELPTCVAPGISENFTASETPTELSSPGFPNYYNNSQTFSWLIHNPNETQVLAMSVDSASRLEGSVSCQYDSVRIYQGPCTTYPLLGEFCGTDRPSFQYGTGSYALVVMTTDATVTYKGFKLRFYLTDQGADDGNSRLLTGIIVGSVLGSAAVLGATVFGIVKYMEYRKRNSLSSCDSSRRSSRSSLPVHETRETTLTPRRLPPIAETRRGYR